MSDKDTIYRQDAIDALADYIHNVDKVMGTGHLTEDDCKDAATSVLEELPSAERKKGKWDEQKVFDTKGSGIEEMQSAKCSKCGRYHTTPYLYFFDDFNFCPNCGADMRGDKYV